MELRTLRYFIAVVREGSITAAAKSLHVTQPTLSRQLAALEVELGHALYQRNRQGIELTEQGVILRRYAESILALADKAEEEIALPTHSIAGKVHIAAGETQAMELIARAMERTQAEYPGIAFEIYSGTSADLMDNFVRGFYDFFLECELRSHVDMHTMKLPHLDEWGLLVRRDDPLANLAAVTAAELVGHPLISSRQGVKVGVLGQWLGGLADKMDVRATYNLPLNAKFLVRQGLGAAFTYRGLFEANAMSDLAFVPLSPALESTQGIVWRKTLPTRQAQAFLDKLREVCAEEPSSTRADS
ncbi:LysR family transcriptional regulator [Adlercreutzia caecimuris]|jgi:DNA-binding transcriptional LysR family regulator|uniref:LysR family transcriptional regulator n=1 Tax=Adlercreutzia caecimuris TaxID=671266 RepID=UPI0013649124|nr:LysR family transcriptional regulator [Adlercreutzia caecimuris]NBJ66029.1 LysR family transcriptional regulator [Adlercreutzia caecimuris]